MARVWLTIGLCAAAAVMLLVGLAAEGWSSWPSLFGNLGSEIIGSAFTVAIVDWLIERKRMREQAQEFAWRLLHDVDHALWVWQGGRREFHLDEMVSLLGLAKPSDPFPPTTEDLFINLGVRAGDMIRLHGRIMRFDKRLRQTCTALKSLSQLREAKGTLGSEYVIDALRTAVYTLAAVTGQRVHEGEFGVAKAFRDPTLRAQEQRYRGTQMDLMGRGLAKPDLGVELSGRVRGDQI